jgi:hypothetical protein
MNTVDNVFFICIFVVTIVGFTVRLIIKRRHRTGEEEKALEQIHKDIPAFRFWAWIMVLAVGLVFAIVFMITN